MDVLKGKKVLFFAADLFGYQIEIKHKMEELGATVDYYDERPSNTFLTKALIRTNRDLLKFRITRYYQNINDQTCKKKYDYIFIIKGESVSTSILKMLRNSHPDAKVILYLWDSIKNNKNALKNLVYFDKILSFDKEDVKNHNFIFRPLFYIDAYKDIDIPEKYMYDALFVGTTHSDRYIFVKKIEKQLFHLNKTVFSYFFFRSIFHYYQKKIFDYSFKDTSKENFHFAPLVSDKLLQLIYVSFAMIDTQHPNQSGLTIRTIEAIGAKRKLITTNQNISLYDFYDPANILIVDRNNPIVTEEFLVSPYKNIDKSIYDKYSITSWLNDVFA